MSYITVTSDVSIDYEDFTDEDILELTENRIKWYENKIKYNVNSERHIKDKTAFVKDMLEALSTTDTDISQPIGKTLQDELYENVFERLKNKYTLEQLEKL